MEPTGGDPQTSLLYDAEAIFNQERMDEQEAFNNLDLLTLVVNEKTNFAKQNLIRAQESFRADEPKDALILIEQLLNSGVISFQFPKRF